MVVVIVTPNLLKQIVKRFGKSESNKILDLLGTVEKNPNKGKQVGLIGNTVIKEIKYKSFRFYFITDYRQLKFLQIEELQDLLIKFVRMSKKNNQQFIINQMKEVLINFDFEGL